LKSVLAEENDEQIVCPSRELRMAQTEYVDLDCVIKIMSMIADFCKNRGTG